MQSRRLTKIVKNIAPILLLYISTNVTAQEKTVTLDMQEAVKTATMQNRNIVVAKLDEQIAKENYRQTNAVFLPQVNFSYTGFITNNPLNAFGLKLQQQTIAQSDFNPATLNHPDATSDFMTKFSAQQPLLNMDMLYQRKGAAKQIELYRHKTERSTEFITWQVKEAYLQLQLAWNVSEVMLEALNTAKATFKVTSDRFEQGLLQKSDLLNVQVQVKNLETRYAEAQANIANASDYLSLLMNKEQGVIYRTQPVTFEGIGEKSNSLPENRADFKAIEAAVESYGYNVKSSKTSYLPRINAFGDYQLHDKSMFGFDANGYLAGVQLSWDIFKGFQTLHKTNTLILERNKLVQQLEDKKEQGRAELSKANRELADASYKIRQQTDAVAQSTEAMRILQNRFEQGLVTTTDVLQSQAQLSQQKLLYTQAIYDRNSSLIHIEFLTITHP